MALLAAEEKYHGIFDHLVEGIFQTTPDGHYVMANAALARIYGYGSPEELMQTLLDIGQRLYVQEDRRDVLASTLAEQHRLDAKDVARTLDNVAAGLKFFDRLELVQKTTSGRATLTLRLRPSHPLRK